MNRSPINSSNITAAGWDDNVLEIQFKHGGVYRYLNVPQQVFDDLMASNSKGQFFHAHIKDEFLWVKAEQAA